MLITFSFESLNLWLITFSFVSQYYCRVTLPPLWTFVDHAGGIRSETILPRRDVGQSIDCPFSFNILILDMKYGSSVIERCGYAVKSHCILDDQTRSSHDLHEQRDRSTTDERVFIQNEPRSYIILCPRILKSLEAHDVCHQR